MTTYSWHSTISLAVGIFGTTCGARLEEDLRILFEEQPTRFTDELTSIGKQMKTGTIHSPYLLLKSRLEKAQGQPDVIVSDSSERERKIIGARAWIHNAGVHFDRWTEVEDELFPSNGSGFNDRGGLNAYDSPELRAELHDAWEQERPRGERAQAEHEAHMSRYVENRKRVAKLLAERRDELDAMQQRAQRER